ncbi:hypothetical protein [Thiolinea disciformis]|uniref:hypothetical protein n=1 Tax=Thiolinea disciformis TaxID=125614 RepID=UPI0003740D20|nr:hypothetical protein [Thiolinea disciformis]
MSKKHVVMIGWHPSAVNYEKWTHLTPEKLQAMLEADRDSLNQLGYQAELCFVRSAETAQADVEQYLAENAVDCVLIGAGVRTDADHFLVFETLVNAVHKSAPQANICFNTNPTDTAAAVQRWV